MKEIIIDEKKGETIHFTDVNSRVPIFAKRNDKLCGMIVKENKGWVLKLGKDSEATGHYEALINCIKSCIPYGYTFFVS